MFCSVAHLIQFFRVSEEDGYNYHQIREELQVQGSEATQHTCGQKSRVRVISFKLYWELIMCQTVFPGLTYIISFHPTKQPHRGTGVAFFLHIRKLGRESLRNLPKFEPWQAVLEARLLVTLPPPVS